MVSLSFILLSIVANLVGAIPLDEPGVKSLTSRCGAFQPWDFMFILDETQPDAYLPVNNYLFQVYQNAGTNGGPATNRKYLLVHFPPTPYDSYGCELIWEISDNTQFFNYTGSQQLDVKQTTAYVPGFLPTWNNVIAGSPSTLGGVFGTVNAVTGVESVVNTATCSNGSPTGAIPAGPGLGFVFKFADWVEQSGNEAALSFYAGYGGPVGVFDGPSLNYNC